LRIIKLYSSHFKSLGESKSSASPTPLPNPPRRGGGNLRANSSSAMSTLTVLLFLSVAVPAWAGNACYTAEQVRAEQALRLHSELMVVTVTCRQGSQGQNLPAAYGHFTKQNIDYLHNAEQTMLGYFKANVKGNPVDNLDRLRTRLANEFGQKSANMPGSTFCEAYRDKVVDYSMAPKSSVEDEVKRMEVAERVYVKPCAYAVTASA